jgi:hypothetical protein
MQPSKKTERAWKENKRVLQRHGIEAKKRGGNTLQLKHKRSSLTAMGTKLKQEERPAA